MESSYMKLYKNINNKKNKIKYNKRKQNSKQQLKKNKSLTYYHFDGQINYINKFHINDLKLNKISNNTNKTLYNNNNCNNNYNNKNKKNNSKINTSFCLLNNYEKDENILLKAYKRSVFELFKALKLYMNKELYKYDQIKREFLKNIQKFYNEEKNKEKNIKRNNTPINNIKSYSKKKLKDSIIENKSLNKKIDENDLYKNYSGYSTSMIKFIKNNNINNNYNMSAYDKLVTTYKYTKNHKLNQIKDNSIIKNKTNIGNNDSMNKSNLSGVSFIQNQNINKYLDYNGFNNHKSLYSLLKKNKDILGNSPIKDANNNRNDNIMKKFIKFSKNISENKNIINNTCNQSIINSNKLLLEKKNDNKIETSKNNELISKIKDSLDDNLKHILNFSYENFLNKESERECN